MQPGRGRRDLVVCRGQERHVTDEHPDDYGDVWTWTAIDVDTKLIPSWLVGERDTHDYWVFLNDLRSRLLPGQRIQLTTDGFGVLPARGGRPVAQQHRLRRGLKEYGTE